MLFEPLLKVIEENDVITIFRHEHPDCDALGSQKGLADWIKLHYPNKQVYRCGKELTDQFDFGSMDEVPDEVIKKSLVIVVDTADIPRIDDGRATTGKTIFKIDHHPNREPYGDYQIVETTAAATCEILAHFFKWTGKELNQTIAEEVYAGLLTDTLCFRTSNTTNQTLEAAAYLANYQVRIPWLNRQLFDQSYADFQFANYLRSQIQMKGPKFAYVILSVNDLKKWNMTGSKARNFTQELGEVKDFEIWAIFTEKQEEGETTYDGSLRSKTLPVNDLAQLYHGGGHLNAAGCKDLTPKDLETLIQQLFQRIEDK